MNHFHIMQLKFKEYKVSKSPYCNTWKLIILSALPFYTSMISMVRKLFLSSRIFCPWTSSCVVSTNVNNNRSLMKIYMLSQFRSWNTFLQVTVSNYFAGRLKYLRRSSHSFNSENSLQINKLNPITRLPYTLLFSLHQYHFAHSCI